MNFTKDNQELRSRLEQADKEKEKRELELIRLQGHLSQLSLRDEKELSGSITNDRIFYGIPNLEKKIDEAIFDAINFFNKKCPFCGNSLYQGHVRSKIEIDHFIPISRGGQNFPWNILPTCKDCNRKKRNKLPSEFLDKKTFEVCFKYLDGVKKHFSADIDCIGSFEMIKKIVCDNMDSLSNKSKSMKVLQDIAELIYPGIQTMLHEAAQDEQISSVPDGIKCLQNIHRHVVHIDPETEMRIDEMIGIAINPLTHDNERKDFLYRLKQVGIKIERERYLVVPEIL